MSTKVHFVSAIRGLARRDQKNSVHAVQRRAEGQGSSKSLPYSEFIEVSHVTAVADQRHDWLAVAGELVDCGASFRPAAPVMRSAMSRGVSADEAMRAARSVLPRAPGTVDEAMRLNLRVLLGCRGQRRWLDFELLLRAVRASG